MNRFKNILLIFDQTTDQHLATHHAESLAKENNAELTLLSVVKQLPDSTNIISAVMPTEKLLSLVINQRQKELDTLVATMKQQGINATAQILLGTAFIEIISQVIREQHDLVIISAENKAGLKERFFGSTVMHLMRKCPCPVWVVKPTKTNKYDRILAAVDVSADAPNAEQESLNPLILQLASSMAVRENSELHVIQVWSLFGGEYMEIRGALSEKVIQQASKEMQYQYAGKLKKLITSIGLNDLEVRKHLVKHDDTADAIVEQVNNTNIDLLVMGTVCRTGIPGFFIGNTAEKVLDEVNCSVLTVKPHDFVTPITLD